MILGSMFHDSRLLILRLRREKRERDGYKEGKTERATLPLITATREGARWESFFYLIHISHDTTNKKAASSHRLPLFDSKNKRVLTLLFFLYSILSFDSTLDIQQIGSTGTSLPWTDSSRPISSPRLTRRSRQTQPSRTSLRVHIHKYNHLSSFLRL